MGRHSSRLLINQILGVNRKILIIEAIRFARKGNDIRQIFMAGKSENLIQIFIHHKIHVVNIDNIQITTKINRAEVEIE